MQIRWSNQAIDDLDSIFQYIENDSLQAATRVAQVIVGGVDALADFPNRGRPGRALNSREVVLGKLPYLVIYELTDQAIYILRVLHGAHSRP